LQLPGRKWLLLLLLNVMLPFPGTAGTLATSPVRIDLDGQKKTSILRVTNKGSASMIVQIDAVSWHQENEKERYSPTQEVLALPALFELKPGEEQFVRVGVRSFPRTDTEQAYRLYLSEVPDQSVPAKESVRVLLRIGIPVFVHTPSHVAPVLRWQASCAGKTLRLQAVNTGSGHAHLLGVTVRKEGEKKVLAGWKVSDYILAGAKRAWSIAVPECPAPKSTFALSVQTEKGLLNEQVVLEK
jgi:fimbrial chaperone protein